MFLLLQTFMSTCTTYVPFVVDMSTLQLMSTCTTYVPFVVDIYEHVYNLCQLQTFMSTCTTYVPFVVDIYEHVYNLCSFCCRHL